MYQQEYFDALITTLQDLAAPHTLIFLAYKLRGEHSQSCLHLCEPMVSAKIGSQLLQQPSVVLAVMGIVQGQLLST